MGPMEHVGVAYQHMRSLFNILLSWGAELHSDHNWYNFYVFHGHVAFKAVRNC